MERLTIGEVCSLLHVKPHIVRYWEQEIDLLSPEKDLSGRRSYSSFDLEILSRIRHLVQERRFTLEGARERLFAELTGPAAGPNMERKAMLQEVRQTLFRAARMNHKLDVMASASIRRGLPLPDELLRAIARTSLEWASAPGKSSSTGVRPRVVRLRTDPPERAPGEDSLCVVTVIPPWFTGYEPAASTGATNDIRIAGLANRLAEEFSRHSVSHEHTRFWLVVVPSGSAAAVTDRISDAALPFEVLVVENIGGIPDPAGKGGNLLDPGTVGLFLLLRYGTVGSMLSSRGITLLGGTDFSEGSSPSPDYRLIYARARWNVSSAFLAEPADENRFTLTGDWLCSLKSIREMSARLPVGLNVPYPSDDNRSAYKNSASLGIRWLALSSLIGRSAIIEGGTSEGP